MLLVSLFRSFARHFRFVFAFQAAATAALWAQSPSAADGFEPSVDGNVYALATQPDGKILLAGQFSSVRPNGSLYAYPRNNLARLNPDGSLDETFNGGTNGAVRAMVLQPDGKILIGGDFGGTVFSSPSGSSIETARNRIARLNADGTVDASFTASVGPALTGLALQPQVFALALQADGAVLVGGAFGSAQSGAAPAVARRNLARFNSAGALDTGYNPNPNGMVLALASHLDGKMVVGGGFTTFQENGGTQVTTRNRIARLNLNGTVDSPFDPNADNGVTSLAVQRDGKIVLGGYFTKLQPVGNDSAANRSHLARLNPDGTIDSEFYPNAGGNVTTIVIAPDGGILVGGPFLSVWGRGATTISFRNAARFTPDGAVDTAFNLGLNAEASAFAFQSDGKIVVGGYFTRAQPPGVASAKVRNRLARFSATGSLDTSFELDAGGRPLVSVVQADGKIVLGGSFTNVGGETHNFLARLNPDGSVDSSYKPDFNGRVLALAYEASSGKILVGGSFTTIGGETRNHIARLNPSGTIDSEFNPDIDGQVGSIVVQSDGKILVGGAFFTAKPLGTSERTTRNNILRLNANGTLDTAFDPNTDASVTSIVVQSDGKIIFGGSFTRLQPNAAANATIRSRLARVNADGTLDTTYDPNFNGDVAALALQGDGKLIVGGAFGLLAPPGSTAATVRSRLVRINPDGTIDAFNPSANGTVLAIALQPDGKILIGGAFTTLTPNGATD
ncbi:MAG: delta-60 repeat domain-containing protein, partial [Opitutaceae bacterium]